MGLFDYASQLGGGGMDSSFAQPQYQQAPMDYGPAEQYAQPGPESFGGQGQFDQMGGGPSTSFQNYDPMQAFQQSFNQMQPSFTSFQPSVPEQPSLFKRIISGMLTGIAGGAGAPDAGSAFAGGFQAVTAADEANRQRRMQEEALQQQQQYQQMQMMNSYLNVAKGYQELQQMPKQMAMQEQQLALESAKMFANGTQPMMFDDENQAMATNRNNLHCDS